MGEVEGAGSGVQQLWNYTMVRKSLASYPLVRWGGGWTFFVCGRWGEPAVAHQIGKSVIRAIAAAFAEDDFEFAAPVLGEAEELPLDLGR